MKEHTRNIAVGLTVIVALAMLGGMIVLFTGLPEIFRGGWDLRMNFSSSSDVFEGDTVYLDGMRVGKVVGIHFVDNDPRKGVQIVARIDSGTRIPANVVPVIHRPVFVGGAYLELVSTGPPRHDPKTGQVLEFLPPDWTRPLAGRIVSASLLPQGASEAITSIGQLADNLNRLVAPASAPASGPSGTQPGSRPGMPPPATLPGVLARMSKTLDSLETIVGSAENRENLARAMAELPGAIDEFKAAMDEFRSFGVSTRQLAADANQTLRKASRMFDNASTAAGQFGQLAEDLRPRANKLIDGLVEDSERISKLVSSMNVMVTRMSSGEGTVGKLINDPKLYNDFAQAARELARLSEQMRQLVEQWKAKGVKLKLF